MKLTLSNEHLGKIVSLNTLTVVTLPENQFKQGDILVLFNNTDQFTTIISDIKNSYRSSHPKKISHFEMVPRSLVNVIFIADDTVVLTFGM